VGASLAELLVQYRIDRYFQNHSAEPPFVTKRLHEPAVLTLQVLEVLRGQATREKEPPCRQILEGCIASFGSIGSYEDGQCMPANDVGGSVVRNDFTLQRERVGIFKDTERIATFSF